MSPDQDPGNTSRPRTSIRSSWQRDWRIIAPLALLPVLLAYGIYTTIDERSQRPATGKVMTAAESEQTDQEVKRILLEFATGPNAGKPPSFEPQTNVGKVLKRYFTSQLAANGILTEADFTQLADKFADADLRSTPTGRKSIRTQIETIDKKMTAYVKAASDNIETLNQAMSEYQGMRARMAPSTSQTRKNLLVTYSAYRKFSRALTKALDFDEIAKPTVAGGTLAYDDKHYDQSVIIFKECELAGNEFVEASLAMDNASTEAMKRAADLLGD